MPKVDSSVITISLKHHSTTSFFDKKFFEIVRAGFANKRKQLWRNLVEGLQWEKDTVVLALREVVGNEQVRAQELDIEQWITLTKKLT